MEVKRHARLAGLVLAGLLIITTLVINGYLSSSTASGRALVTRVFNVQPAKNGLSHVSFRQSPSLADSPAWNQSGPAASLEFTLK